MASLLDSLMRPRSTPFSRVDPSPPPAAPPPDVKTVCVIGAGSSGLVAAKYLLAAGYKVAVYEKGDGIGGTFVTKAYDNAGLVSSKFLTAFSDLRSPPSDAPHLTLVAYCAYLQKYAEQHGLLEHITFGAHVEAVERRDGGAAGYDVRLSPVAPPKPTEAYPVDAVDGSSRLQSDVTRRYDAVCVCSGLHEAPFVPEIPGLDSFSGAGGVLHSCDYKDKSVFAGKRALVVGCGETGMDLAYRAVQVASETAMSIKKGFLAVPHEGWGGVPLDTLIANLFEHAYEHWWTHKHHLKWKFTTRFIKVGFWVMGGSTCGYNQWVGGLDEVKRGYHILCKSTAALPYLNRPLKQKAWWYSWLWAWNEKAVDKSIYTYPAPTSVEGTTVTFRDGRSYEADIIVLATGYRQTFPFLHTKANKASAEASAEASAAASAEAGVEPRAAVGAAAASGGARAEGSAGGRTAWKLGTGARGAEDPLPGEHFIIAPDEPTLAFIGFVRPNVGAIPPMAELQVMWWLQRLQGATAHQTQPVSYMLLGKKLAYGVDYGNYMHQLAAEIGAAPTISQLLARSPRAFIAWALGQAYIPFFRLVGPYASEECWKVAETELYQPVVKRGLFANAMLILTMLLFGCINLCAFAVDALLGGSAALGACAQAAVDEDMAEATARRVHGPWGAVGARVWRVSAP